MDTSDTAAGERRHNRRQIEVSLFSLEADHSQLIRRRDEHVLFVRGLRQKVHQAEEALLAAEAELTRLEGGIDEKALEVSQAKKLLRLL